MDIKISVRNLIEFVLRSGNLDNRKNFSAEKDAMQAGSRLHRKIQKSMGADYQSEVSLSHRVLEDQFSILIEGRADGVMTSGAGVTIDEIKGVYQDVSHLQEPIAIHMAQAMCYGYIYSFDHNLSSIRLQLTYANIETEEIRRFQVDHSYEELELWFQGLIHEYVKWARYLYHHGIRREESIKNLDFPYPYREGQRELAVSVYRSISRGRDLFIQAPTGIGKTLSTVYPSLKAMGEGYGEKLFYLTAKTVTRKVAEETFAVLREHELYFKTVTITAKEKLCMQERPECNPEACPYAKGHFDRVNDAVYEIIHQEFLITREVILDYAMQYQVCPFEFCLDITNWVDGIICDYNYVFDPNVKLKRYFSEGVSGNYLFLVDEAHNLVPRGRQMYSSQLLKEDFLLMKRILKGRSEKIQRLLERCNKVLLEMKRECSHYVILPGINHVANVLLSLFGEMERFMEEHSEFEDRDLVLDFYFALRNFLTVFEELDDSYRIYTQLQSDGTFLLRLFCINPARNLQKCLKKGKSTIFFSATLLPIRYYKELLSGNQEDYAVYAESPFSEKNRMLLVASDVSSKYTRRNQNEYRKVVEYIRCIVASKMGNYMVFFPSYQYMKEVEQLLVHIAESDSLQCISQSSHMNEAEREDFLSEFNEKRIGSLVALCVMGGVFSEGIDLKEERLIGAIIIGTGFPMVCTEQDILKQYFDEREKPGFDFAYQYPGMNKVMQAAGRVIRTVTDKGVIALLDERFLRADYRSLFPREWQDFVVVSQSTLEEKLNSFWRGTKL